MENILKKILKEIAYHKGACEYLLQSYEFSEEYETEFYGHSNAIYTLEKKLSERGFNAC